MYVPNILRTKKLATDIIRLYIVNISRLNNPKIDATAIDTVNKFIFLDVEPNCMIIYLSPGVILH